MDAIKCSNYALQTIHIPISSCIETDKKRNSKIKMRTREKRKKNLQKLTQNNFSAHQSNLNVIIYISSFLARSSFVDLITAFFYHYEANKCHLKMLFRYYFFSLLVDDDRVAIISFRLNSKFVFFSVISVKMLQIFIFKNQKEKKNLKCMCMWELKQVLSV